MSLPSKSQVGKNSVEFARLMLADVGFVLRNLLVFECAWLPQIASFKTKIVIGEGIGYSAQALEHVAVRVRELNELEPNLRTSRPAVVKAFKVGSSLSNLEDKVDFIVGTTKAIQDDLSKILENTDPVFDQPTMWAIDLVTSILTRKLCDWGSVSERAASLELGPFASFNENTDSPSRIVVPTSIDHPLRPDCLTLSDENILNKPTEELLLTHDGIRRFIHFIYSEIEVSAAEICARNIFDFGEDLPIQFTFDMARQCMDEMRHARMADQMLSSYGGKLGDYTYRHHVWNAYTQGESLAEKLAIEQIIGEGNGLDTTALSIKIFDKVSLPDLKHYYQFLQADETIHCAFGNRWIAYLVDYDEAKFFDVVDSALEKIGSTVPGFAPVDIDLRLNGEFSKEFVYRKLLKKPLPRQI